MFNLSKFRKNRLQKISQSSPPSYAQMLNEQNAERNYTIDNSTPNLNGLLDEQRENSDLGEIHEANLNDVRGESYDHNNKTLEAQLDDRDSYVVHRSDKYDKPQMKAMDSLSEAFDQKRRKAYKEAEEKGDNSFWDKYVAEQLLGEKTTISRNIPDEFNQLQNNPDRFESMNGEPTESLATDNFSSYTKSDNIKPMVMAEAEGLLKDADAILLHTYYTAAKQNRSLNEDEQMIINAVSADKHRILAQLKRKLDRETDFLDGNPTVETPFTDLLPPDDDQNVNIPHAEGAVLSKENDKEVSTSPLGGYDGYLNIAKNTKPGINYKNDTPF